ncbi:MAG: hypothetical protein Q4F98_06085 [Lachnospiraceae bacterium]|nr:hypothetical protein [Lachnospiraceae bacterium]
MNENAETFNINCEICKNHCNLIVEAEGDEVLDVTGNGCMRGYAYAQTHLPEGKEK